MFHLELGVNIIGKEPNFALIGQEAVDFVDLDEGAPQFNGLLDLGGAPFPSERALLGRLVTEPRFFQQGFRHLLFHARLAEWERKFALVSMGQDGMVQSVWK